MLMVLGRMVLGIVTILLAQLAHGQTANVYDTYNADECARVRKPWHLLNDEERSLYISGILALRNRDGILELDDFVSIASVHGGQNDMGSYIGAIHRSSTGNFYHSYLTFELESRIRNLGGKYACFGMPYYDVTIEHGRERDPFIFTTGLGGDGDPENHYTVNEYSWNVTTKEFWIPDACIAADDDLPFCSLKRKLTSFTIPNAREYGDFIIKHPNAEEFARGYFDLDNFGGFFVAGLDAEDGYHNNMGYEPVWPLYHSFVQYHQSIWADCNEYDRIPLDELDAHSDAYTPFNGGMFDGYIALELDEPIMFPGLLQYREWSFIHDNDLTVRKLWDQPSWNVIYDLGDGQGFFTDSGLREYCAGKLNASWFILDDDDDGQNEEYFVVGDERFGSASHWNINESMIFTMVIFGFLMMILMKERCVWKKEKNLMEKVEYGSMMNDDDDDNSVHL